MHLRKCPNWVYHMAMAKASNTTSLCTHRHYRNVPRHISLVYKNNTRSMYQCRTHGQGTTEYSGSGSMMISWDVDNVFPRTLEHIPDVIDAIIDAIHDDETTSECRVLLGVNSTSMERLCLVSGLERHKMHTRVHSLFSDKNSAIHVEFVETPKRKNAVDRALEQRMIQFTESMPAGCICCCISNDADFGNTLQYCSYKGSHVVSIGTVKRTKNANYYSKKHTKKLVDSSDDAWRLEMDTQGGVRLSRYGKK